MSRPPSRRDLLANLGVLFGLVPGAALALHHVFRFLIPTRKPREEEVLVGRLSGLAPGTSRPLEGVHGNSLIVVRLADGRVRAFSSICTHLGCRVQWDPVQGNFLCPCHMGRFDTDGEVIAGPPPTTLPSFPTRVDGDSVFVVVPVREA